MKRSTETRMLVIVMAAAAACGVQEHPVGSTVAGPGNSPASGSSGGAGGGSSGGGRSGTTTPAGGGGPGSQPAAGGSGGTVPGTGGQAGPTGGSTGAGGASGGARDGGGATAGASGSTDAGAAAADAASPMPTIDINGTKVPRDKAIVFIHFGHSNMAGRANVPTDLRPYFFTPQPRLWSYVGGKFVAAKEPTAGDGESGQGAGPGMAWLRTAADAAGPDYHFISIARAQGAKPTADFVKGGPYYRFFVDPAKELKGKVTFGGVFTMLGITDRHMPVPDQAGFADRMVKIMADIRADLGEPNLPMLNCDYEVESTGTLNLASDFAKRIRPLILSLPMRIPNSAIINTDKLGMLDDHHFNMAGHKLWAERGIQIMKTKGWFPWAK